MRLIDVDDLLEEYCGECEAYQRGYCDRDICPTIRWINEAPTIEARPVVRGEWELHGDDDDLSASYFCSVCGYNMDEDEYLDSFSSYNYCPSCGADMRGEE